jgi:predicted regulator of Ras-like GTPase activity (Roadblock/LC7/MglB family)
MIDNYEEQFARICREVLDDFSAACPGLIDAAVCTKDGMEVARLAGSNSKTAVMSGTMKVLGEAIARESSLDACRSVSVEAEGGNLVIVPVHDAPNRHLVLAGVGGRDTNLGLLLVQCKYSSHMIGRMWQMVCAPEGAAHA